jgi:hypothetical protein
MNNENILRLCSTLIRYLRAKRNGRLIGRLTNPSFGTILQEKVLLKEFQIILIYTSLANGLF